MAFNKGLPHFTTPIALKGGFIASSAFYVDGFDEDTLIPRTERIGTGVTTYRTNQMVTGLDRIVRYFQRTSGTAPFSEFMKFAAILRERKATG